MDLVENSFVFGNSGFQSLRPAIVTDIFIVFSQSVKVNVGNIHEIRPRPLPHRLSPVLCLLIILPY
jgi:hypothetical protein